MTDTAEMDLFAEDARFYRVQLADPCPVCGGDSFAKYGNLYRCYNCRATLIYYEAAGGGACAACGRSNPASSVYCGHCGAALTRLAALRHCPRCGQGQHPQFAYCTRCGYGIANALHAEDVTECRTCAQTVPAGEAFCLNCGSALTASGDDRPGKRGLSINVYQHCPACGTALQDETSDLCPACGTDASDYIDMIRAVTRDQVAQVVAEEEATLLAAHLAKPKRDGGPGRPIPNTYPQYVVVGLSLLLLVTLLLIALLLAATPPL